MDVSIAAEELREFAAAMACLGRVGHQLSLVASEGSLAVRALNGAKSAFMALDFRRFESFEAEDFSCTILAKPVIGALRNLRTVSRLRIYLEDDAGPEPHLVFQLVSVAGIVRCHRLTIGEGDVLQATFDPEGSSRFATAPVTFSSLFEHIHGTDELQATVLPTNMRLRSYHSGSNTGLRRGVLGKVLQTVMSISSAEFDEYDFAGPPEGTRMVFCFREVKALMSLCDAVEGMDLEMQFHDGGRPLLFAARREELEVELIMSTMLPREPDGDGGPDGQESATGVRTLTQPTAH